MLPVEARGPIDPALLAALRASLGGVQTLHDVVQWGARQVPVRPVRDVVVQDEFTHDVLVEGPEGRWLVFDTA